MEGVIYFETTPSRPRKRCSAKIKANMNFHCSILALFYALVCFQSPGKTQTKAHRQPTPRFWSSSSLHRLNEDIMAEAQSLEGRSRHAPVQEEKNEKRKGRQNRQDQKQQKMDRAQSGRGGALTAVKTPSSSTSTSNSNPSTRNGFFRWLAPAVSATVTALSNDGHRVETPTGDSDRLPDNDQGRRNKFKENSDTSTESNINDNSISSVSTRTTSSTQADLAQLWWVNVWTQQLPHRPSLVQKSMPSTVDQDEEKTNKRSRESTRRENEKVESEELNAKQSKEDFRIATSKKGADNIESDTYDKKTTTATIVPEALATLAEDAQLSPADYVSSGMVSSTRVEVIWSLLIVLYRFIHDLGFPNGLHCSCYVKL